MSPRGCVGCFLAQLKGAERVLFNGHSVSVVGNVREEDKALASVIVIFSTECGAKNSEGREKAVTVAA